MIIPEFLKENDTIGVTACSSGVLDKIDKYEKSINYVKKQGFNILETNNVRTGGLVSSDAKTRVEELNSLIINKDIKMINIAAGGDLLCEILPLVDYDLIKNNPKWYGGSSDPTSLLYSITTKLDMPTIYTPCNMSGYSSDNLHQSYLDYFQIIKGNLVKQYKSEKYESDDDIFDLDNEWNSYGKDIDQEGVLLGGCIDCLKDIIGTKFDNTLDFIEKHKDEGIIWYFDVFSLSVEDLYRTLLQFKNAGWFKYTKLVLVGKVRFPNTFTELTYEEMIKKALDEYDVIYNFDVGHVKPSMTMINGFKARVKYNKNEGSLEYLK